jgi:hypothetical protein
MDSNSQYFIALLVAFLKNTIAPKPVDVDWNKIYDLASTHSLSGAVYLAIQRLEEDKKPELLILNKFKSDFFYTTLRYEEQEKAYCEIIRELNKEKIEHLFFKGIVVRDYYPVKQMRTLGDIDFLIHKKDQNAVCEIFTQMGYKNKSSELHDKYEKGKIIIEAHDKIINTEINSKVDYFAYFENAWDYSIANENKYTYELCIDYHLVFLLTHIAKHIYEAGAGVRMILDIAVIIDKFGDTLDFTFIWKELKKIKLDMFARNIFGLCEKWFQVKIPDTTFEMDALTYRAMSEYIFDGGTFGFSNNNVAIWLLRNSYSKETNLKIVQIKAFWRKIFLNFGEMKEKYPFLKKRPFLLPAAWVHRWYKGIIKTPAKTLKLTKGLFNCTEEAEQSYDMLKRIGL